MSEFFLTAHAWWQYLALIAVLVAIVFSLRKSPMDETAETVYRIAGAAVGIQVLLGLVLWIVNSGWSLGFLQGWLHPIIGIAAAGVLNASVGRARKGPAEAAARTVRIGVAVATVLVIAAIAIGEAA